MNNKFGMFIHWGIYSQLGLHEQCLARYFMDRKEYDSLVKTFNPVNYDPEEWVLLAKKSGMKYICFTTKHHDGFCMWDTKYTDYNIMHTPYGKDALKMLADACEKHGMLLSLYYSNPDWHHEYGYNSKSSHQWRAINRNKENTNFEEYKSFIKNQITELLTNYGKIYTLFWDIPPQLNDPSINNLVRELQPEILINDRGFDEGDFSTPEREHESGNGMRYTRMTEACNSLGSDSWAYRKNDSYYSLRYLLSEICAVMAKGGSYLLNVGPMADGKIPEIQVEKLKKIGDWFNRTEGVLEGHTPDETDYGIKYNTCIPTKKNGKTYLNFYNGMNNNAVLFKNVSVLPKSVRILNTGNSLPFECDYFPTFYYDDPEDITHKYLRIYDIPVDDLPAEPIIIEIDW